MSAILRSNSGHSDLTIDLVGPASYAHDAGFEASVYIRAAYWDGDHTHPTAVSVAGLWLRGDDLTALRDHIAAWVNQPLDQLDPERLNGAFELTRLPGQHLSVTFGARPDTIAHFNPVVSVLLATHILRSEFHFVTDQSCLTMFVSELVPHLNELQPNIA
jgi:hypothetical protein